MTLIDLHIATIPANAAFLSDAVASTLPYRNDITVHQFSGATTLLDARKQGVAQGTSEYVTWLDDDDTLTNLQPLIDFIKVNKPDAIFTNSNVIDANGNVVNTFFPPRYGFDQSRLLNGAQAPHQMIVIKRALLEQAIINVEQCALALDAIGVQSWSVEYALCLEIASRTNWVYFDEICYNWRQHSPSQMHNFVTTSFGEILNYYRGK